MTQGIYIGLGSNMGDRRANLAQAIALSSAFLTVQKQSPLYENSALLPENAPEEWDRPFYNQVIEVHTALKPQALLTALKQVERKMGREDGPRWAPRIIDLDILSYHAEMHDGADLQLPHPQMHQRDFVLKPLFDIAPNWHFPNGHSLANTPLKQALQQLNSPLTPLRAAG